MRISCENIIDALAYATTIGRIIKEHVNEDLSLVELDTIHRYANAIARWAREEASSSSPALQTQTSPKTS